MPAAASKDRSWTWTDLVGIAALTGATLEPGRADDPGARTLYFDAVAADAAEAPGEGEGAGRKLHPMVAASEAAHALEAQKRCASTTEPSIFCAWPQCTWSQGHHGAAATDAGVVRPLPGDALEAQGVRGHVVLALGRHHAAAPHVVANPRKARLPWAGGSAAVKRR